MPSAEGREIAGLLKTAGPRLRVETEGGASKWLVWFGLKLGDTQRFSGKRAGVPSLKIVATVGGQTPFRTLLKPWDTMFVGICKENIIPGFLRWCEMDLVHPR